MSDDSIFALREDTIFSLREIKRQFEQPWDIEIAISTMTPQALLRDLHRPESKFTVSADDWQRIERPTDCGMSAVRNGQTDFRQNLRVPIADLLHTSRDMLDEWRALKTLLRQPWSDAPKFGKKYVPEGLLKRWFGGHEM